MGESDQQSFGTGLSRNTTLVLILTLLLFLTSWIPSAEAGLVHTYTPTDADRLNPNYTDACYESLQKVCSYCCILSTGVCSRDNRACNPTRQRNFEYLIKMMLFIGSVSLGCPCIALMIRIVVQYRCCRHRYPTTGGISCLEFILRKMCCCWFHYQRLNLKPSVDEEYLQLGLASAKNYLEDQAMEIEKQYTLAAHIGEATRADDENLVTSFHVHIHHEHLDDDKSHDKQNEHNHSAVHSAAHSALHSPDEKKGLSRAGSNAQRNSSTGTGGHTRSHSHDKPAKVSTLHHHIGRKKQKIDYNRDDEEDDEEGGGVDKRHPKNLGVPTGLLMEQKIKGMRNKRHLDEAHDMLHNMRATSHHAHHNKDSSSMIRTSHDGPIIPEHEEEEAWPSNQVVGESRIVGEQSQANGQQQPQTETRGEDRYAGTLATLEDEWPETQQLIINRGGGSSRLEEPQSRNLSTPLQLVPPNNRAVNNFIPSRRLAAQASSHQDPNFGWGSSETMEMTTLIPNSRRTTLPGQQDGWGNSGKN